jgi:hypothetical protein
MKDLQNRLDQQGAPDFDREALWQRIERPRKRRGFLWWWLGAGSLILISWFSLGKGGIPPALSGFYIGVAEQEQDQDRPVAQVEKSKGEILPSDKPFEEEPVATLDLKPEIVRKVAPEKAKVDGKLQSDRRVEASGAQPKLGDKERQQLKPTAALVNIVESEVAPAPFGSNTVANPIFELKKQEALSLLPTLPVALTDDRRSTDFPLYFAASEQTKSRKNAFVLSGGLAAQLHTNSTDCSWAGEERTRPGFYLRGQYQRGLGNGFYAFGAAQYTTHHSRLEARHTISTKTLNAFNQEVRNSETTLYELYNQYERVEIGVGLGKTWDLKAFTFALEASGGYSHWLKVDGNYLNQEGVLQSLAPASEVPGSWTGRLDVSVLKPVTEHWTIGLTMQAQTPVLVSPGVGSCTRRMYPVGVGVLVGRWW